MVMNTHPYFHRLCFNWKCLQEKGISTVCDLKQTSWAFCALRPCQWMHEANRNKGTPSAVYLCIHFMIWKELDFTKIGICSNTKNLCLEAQSSIASYHMQRVEMIDSLKPERRWRHCPCPMTLPAAAGLVASDIWSHCRGTDGYSITWCRFWQRLGVTHSVQLGDIRNLCVSLLWKHPRQNVTSEYQELSFLGKLWC